MSSKKLTTEQIDFIKEAATVASTLGIESLLIDNDHALGLLKEEGRIIITPNPHDFPFDEMGIFNLKSLMKRLNMFNDAKVTVKIGERDNSSKIVEKIMIKSGASQVEFSCHHPSMIKVFRNLKDAIAFRFSMDEEMINMVSKASQAMSSKVLTFMNVDDNIIVKLNDDVGDSFAHMISDKLTVEEDAKNDSFSHSYDVAPIITLAKKAKDYPIPVKMTNRGVLIFTINGFDIYLTATRL